MMRGVASVKKIIRRVKSRFVPKVIILIYHRVADLPSDPQLLAIKPQHFKEHLEVLSSRASPTSLGQLTEALNEGDIPNRGVILTFDDGYADNLGNAKPLLEHYDIPATVFVCSDTISSQREFWWDELESDLLLPGTLPEKLSLNIHGDSFNWELGESAEYSEPDYWQNRGWSVEEKITPSLRHNIYRSLHHQLRSLPSSERQKVMDELSTLAGKGIKARSDYLSLAAGEIPALVRGGLVDVGAHTVTHPTLSSIPQNEQLAEINKSKTELEKVLGRPVTSFAYPYGSKLDYSMETVAMVRRAGFICACSNYSEAIKHDTDLFQLPRMIVRDWDRDTFAHKLEAWFNG